MKKSGGDIIIQLNKQNIFSFIECCILSFPLILMLFYFTFLFVSELVWLLKGAGISWRTMVMIGDIPFVVSIISIYISNFIFYYVLKKKYNFKMNVFLYGVGFTSCCVTFVFLIQGKLQGSFWSGTEFLFWSLFCILSFVLVYYSYAILLLNEKKEVNKVTSYLIIMIIISSLILIVLEIITLHPPIAGGVLFLFGLYLVCVSSFKKIRISLRRFAWSLFLPFFVIFWYVFLTTPFM